MRRFAVLLWVSACHDVRPDPGVALAPVDASLLRAPADFAGLDDAHARSAALFLEASRVMAHPRCSNCHPAGDSPLQGAQAALHEPPVHRGPDNQGVSGMTCPTCHQEQNVPLARVPGAPHWQLAPVEMAWVGRTPADICAQLKDPQRNGHRTLAQIVDHGAHDPLVAWAWQPGSGREPAPGSQQAFGALLSAWVETGAECPKNVGAP